jgi:hypothetical protein
VVLDVKPFLFGEHVGLVRQYHWEPRQGRRLGTFGFWLGLVAAPGLL